MADMNTVGINFEIGLDHPAVGAIAVSSKQAGYLPIKKLEDHLKALGIPEDLIPKRPESGSIHLQRAMKDAIRGTRGRVYDIKTTGKGKNLEVAIVNFEKGRISREKDDGRGIAHSILSARIKMDPHTKNDELVFFPDDSHPFVDDIRERYEFHRQHYKCAEDLSRWVSQTVMASPLTQAVPRPGHGGGLYYVPKGDGFELVVRIRDALNEINSTNRVDGRLNQGIKIYLMPMITTFPDVVDALTDALIDNFEKEAEELEAYLLRYEEDDVQLRNNGLETNFKKCDALKEKLEAFRDSCGTSTSDLTIRIEALKSRLGIAQLQRTG